ncbi:MAG TPA: AI-2E family transporter [Ferruginibacter sp.]|nr:AI-2E family transporter [Ferruginibacter sp.]HRE63573.1 AI-2E family transporter [Ferruginibacter sp.]
MNQNSFNDRLVQIILLGLIIVLGLLLVFNLTAFLPGILGGATVYILCRSLYFKLIYKLKWKKGLTAILFIVISIIIVSIPIFISIQLISPKINELVNNQDKIINSVRLFTDRLEAYTGFKIFTDETVKNISGKITSFIPTILNSTASIFTNLVIMFFLLYYMLVNGKEIEQYLQKVLPFRRKNINALATETKTMIRASSIGIPIICIVQGLTATVGYWIFGVHDWGLWGFVTGVFAFFPLVGTMIVWVPIVVYMLASGHQSNAIFLLLYSVAITGNVDYLARLTLMKKMGDIHPLITVFGVIMGMNLFGFVGLIFGPLLISYFIILVKIYNNEYSMDEFAQERQHDTTN